MTVPSSAPIRQVVLLPLRLISAVTGPWTKQNLLSWTLILLAILFLKGCIVDQYTIPTGSMEPTLHGDPRFFRGDRVLVNKWVYGPRIPFTTIRLWNWEKPKRWDIVVFRAAHQNAQHSTLVKRVVALPGEKVYIKSGRLFINDKEVPYPEGMPPNHYYYTDMDMIRMAAQAASPEQEQEIKRIREAYPLCYAGLDTPEFTQVPEGSYLLLGDNSLQSVDGRVWGWLPENHLLGRVFGVWWPLPRRYDFTGFSYTWWGKSLIYGIPTMFILLEILLYWRERKQKARKNPPQNNTTT